MKKETAQQLMGLITDKVLKMLVIILNLTFNSNNQVQFHKESQRVKLLMKRRKQQLDLTIRQQLHPLGNRMPR
jgi:hypothetical protein